MNEAQRIVIERIHNARDDFSVVCAAGAYFHRRNSGLHKFSVYEHSLLPPAEMSAIADHPVAKKILREVNQALEAALGREPHPMDRMRPEDQDKLRKAMRRSREVLDRLEVSDTEAEVAESLRCKASTYRAIILSMRAQGLETSRYEQLERVVMASARQAANIGEEQYG
jgi:hypothetical protein